METIDGDCIGGGWLAIVWHQQMAFKILLFLLSRRHRPFAMLVDKISARNN